MFIPRDSGPLYAETIHAAPMADSSATVMGVIVEPLNTLSNLAFLFVVVYWAWILRNSRHENSFIKRSLPVLFIGWLGGTLYHGTRSHQIWFLLDYVPIVILCLSASLHFWRRLGMLYRGILFSFAFLVVARLAIQSSPSTAGSVTLHYLMLVTCILAPVVGYAKKTRWSHAAWMSSAIGSVALALAFRQAGGWVAPHFEYGTHFLWHTFGGVSTFCLVRYVWLTSLPTTLSPKSSDVPQFERRAG